MSSQEFARECLPAAHVGHFISITSAYIDKLICFSLRYTQEPQ